MTNYVPADALSGRINTNQTGSFSATTAQTNIPALELKSTTLTELGKSAPVSPASSFDGVQTRTSVGGSVVTALENIDVRFNPLYVGAELGEKSTIFEASAPGLKSDTYVQDTLNYYRDNGSLIDWASERALPRRVNMTGDITEDSLLNTYASDSLWDNFTPEEQIAIRTTTEQKLKDQVAALSPIVDVSAPLSDVLAKLSPGILAQARVKTDAEGNFYLNEKDLATASEVLQQDVVNQAKAQDIAYRDKLTPDAKNAFDGFGSSLANRLYSASQDAKTHYLTSTGNIVEVFPGMDVPTYTRDKSASELVLEALPAGKHIDITAAPGKASQLAAYFDEQFPDTINTPMTEAQARTAQANFQNVKSSFDEERFALITAHNNQVQSDETKAAAEGAITALSDRYSVEQLENMATIPESRNLFLQTNAESAGQFRASQNTNIRRAQLTEADKLRLRNAKDEAQVESIVSDIQNRMDMAYQQISQDRANYRVDGFMGSYTADGYSYNWANLMTALTVGLTLYDRFYGNEQAKEDEREWQKELMDYQTEQQLKYEQGRYNISEYGNVAGIATTATSGGDSGETTSTALTTANTTTVLGRL